MHTQKSVEGSGSIIQDQISSVPFTIGNSELNSCQNSGTAYFEDLISHCQGSAFIIWFQDGGTNI